MSIPLVSVIVPVYNVEKYLRKCIDSIVAQTYTNLEIVLVDDGSTDESPIICDEYLKKDNRVKVIHQENYGVAKARNVGLNNATGRYIAFVDSDDCVVNKYIECLYNGLCIHNADISIASFSSFRKEYDIKFSVDYAVFRVISKSECFERYTSIKTNAAMSFIVPWNKLYKRELFLEIKYPEEKLYDDAFTTYKILDKAECVVYSPIKLYYYRLNPRSILGQSFRERHLEMIEAFKDGTEYFSRKGEKKISEMFLPPLLMREIYCWWGAKKLLKNDRITQKIITSYRNDCKKLKYTTHVGLLWFLIFKMIACCPWLYVLYRSACPKYLGDR